MPKLYLAKVNLNSKIFSVYDNELDIKDVMKSVYDNINMVDTHKDLKFTKYSDSKGNVSLYKKVSSYSFAEVKKEKGIVTGTLLREFTRPNDEVNDTTGKVESVVGRESVGIRFYFDVNREMVAFCERQCFGYNQFTNAFNSLLNKCVKDYEFETFLQKDGNKLEEKIKELHKITKVRAVLVPPNPNGGSVKSIRDKCISTNSTKMTWEFESIDMRMDSEEMEEIKDYISAGYGDLTATGININGKTQRISSSQDAAFCNDIEENLNDEDFNSESKALIIRFEEYKKRKTDIR